MPTNPPDPDSPPVEVFTLVLFSDGQLGFSGRKPAEGKTAEEAMAATLRTVADALDAGALVLNPLPTLYETEPDDA